MKEKILKLREEGKSYREIEKILGCSRSTISYHCQAKTKQKTYDRTKKIRAEKPILRKVENFKTAKINKKAMQNRIQKFQLRLPEGGNALMSETTMVFGYNEVIEKIGSNPKCHLTGREVDILVSSDYQLDHNIPVSKGGDNSLENLEIACKDANQAKGGMTNEEFFQLCKEVLEHNGYKVTAENKGNDPSPLVRDGML